MSPSPEEYDFVKPLRVLARHEVRFVVIGGIGGRLRGSTTITSDLDVCYARDDENLKRLAAALQELNAKLRNVPEDVPFLLDWETLKAGDHFTFTTDAGSLDCLGTPSGVGGFDELFRAADDFDLGDFTARVASIDDLIRMKRAAGRPKDLIEVEVLGALRDEIDAQALAARRSRRRRGP